MAGISSNPLNPAPPSIACPYCETLMPEAASFCPACGHPMKAISQGDRIAAVVGYLPLIPAVVLLLLPAFRGKRFVRFHAWQSLLLWGVFLVLTVVAVFLSNIAAAVFLLLLGAVASLGMFFLWVVLSLKAWQGERFVVPLFGWLALHLAQ